MPGILGELIIDNVAFGVEGMDVDDDPDPDAPDHDGVEGAPDYTQSGALWHATAIERRNYRCAKFGVF